LTLKEALAGFESYLLKKGYSELSRKAYLRYMRNRFPLDLFQLLPFKNIFGYHGNLHFLTMGDYLKHFPGDYPLQDYVLSLKVEALEHRVIRVFWENTSAGKAPRCLIRYLQESGYLSQPVIVRRKPKWKREVENLTATESFCPQTLKEGFACYLNHLINAQNATEQGLYSQYHQLKAALEWLSGQKVQFLSEVDSELVMRFLDYRHYERDNSQTTLHHAAAALKAMFTFLHLAGFLAENPLVSLRAKKHCLVSAKNLPTPLEMQALLKSAQLNVNKYQDAERAGQKKRFLALRNRVLIYLLCTTGIRSGELLALTVEQIDYAKGCLKIYGKGNSRYAKKVRPVFLEDEATVDALAEYLNYRPVSYGSTLFLTTNGLPLTAGDLRRVVAEFVRQAELENSYSPHKLRAGFAGLMVAQGIDPLTLKELMGHDSLQTTLKCYVALEEDQLRQVWKECNPLSRLLGGETDDN